MSESFQEFETVASTEPLRQGDVLEAVNEDATAYEALLVVITADCDLANSKNAGRVTCIPILGKSHYTRNLQLPRIREKITLKQNFRSGGATQTGRYKTLRRPHQGMGDGSFD